MFVFIGKYRKRLSVYRALEYISNIFNLSDNTIDKIYDVLKFDYLQKILDYWNNLRIIKVDVNADDVWNLDHTLSCIIYKSLLKFKKEASPFSLFYVCDEDLPEELKIDENIDPDIDFKKFEYVIDRMIEAFSLIMKQHDDDDDEVINYDDYIEKIKENNKKIEQGLYLFSKYYRNLWI